MGSIRLLDTFPQRGTNHAGQTSQNERGRVRALPGLQRSGYAGDLVRTEGLSEAEALRQARAELDALLPQGPETEGQHMRIILNAESGQPVGRIWYFYEEYQSIRQVFISDLRINEAERRKGSGTAALAEMESAARRDGCTESVLHVFRDNAPAIRLYQRCGYAAFRRTESGEYWKKGIGERQSRNP